MLSKASFPIVSYPECRQKTQLEPGRFLSLHPLPQCGDDVELFFQQVESAARGNPPEELFDPRRARGVMELIHTNGPYLVSRYADVSDMSQGWRVAQEVGKETRDRILFQHTDGRTLHMILPAGEATVGYGFKDRGMHYVGFASPAPLWKSWFVSQRPAYTIPKSKAFFAKQKIPAKENWREDLEARLNLKPDSEEGEIFLWEFRGCFGQRDIVLSPSDRAVVGIAESPGFVSLYYYYFQPQGNFFGEASLPHGCTEFLRPAVGNDRPLAAVRSRPARVVIQGPWRPLPLAVTISPKIETPFPGSLWWSKIVRSPGVLLRAVGRGLYRGLH
jgi:hypothetical protein